jgi:chromosome partitioning protein
VQTLRERFGALLLDTMIRDNIVLAESPSAGKDIFSYRPRSFGAEDYLKLSEEVMDRLANPVAAEPSFDESYDPDALETFARMVR